MKTRPHLKFEQELWRDNYLVCGIDEVGRGSFAGPLVVGAVILKPITHKFDLKELLSLGINDSKLLSPRKRSLILKCAQEYVLRSLYQYISVDIINEKGIGEANNMGFEQVAQAILFQGRTLEKNIFFLTDAFTIPGIDTTRQKNIIRGDATSISIALASIIAKVERDSYMEKLSLDFPFYNFAKHKGYGTKYHRAMIKEHGPCVQHRTDFIKNYI